MAWTTKATAQGYRTGQENLRRGDENAAPVWLASDDSDYITGASLYVDGGMTLYSGFETGG